mmetsp:Transcript_2146/g.3837  ORF Transcript_2146/g.3837 Transcript_2146/m.3837 type:complete len:204 (+) Transcript_2146:57-668(+)
MIHMLDSLLLLFSHYVLLLWNITHSLFIFRRTSPDINYFYDGAVELNFCTLENGRFFNCVYSTKYATISKPEDDEYEIVPLRFDIQGLPEDVNMRDLKEEMNMVLKRILVRLSEKIEGLKVSNIKERVVDDRGRRDLMQKALISLSQQLQATTREEAHHHRALEKDISLSYNVYVVRDENKKFGPLIISEMRKSYVEVLEQIQ